MLQTYGNVFIHFCFYGCIEVIIKYVMLYYCIRSDISRLRQHYFVKNFVALLFMYNK